MSAQQSQLPIEQPPAQKSAEEPQGLGKHFQQLVDVLNRLSPPDEAAPDLAKLPEPITNVKGIHQKLWAIMSEADYVRKDKRNDFHGYNYASEAAIKMKLHQLFVKYRVILHVNQNEPQYTEISRNEKGKAQFRTNIRIDYKFLDIDDQSALEGRVFGAGVDGEDKGIYKAITGAVKYLLSNQFLIPTGDDPEKEEGAADEGRGKQQKPAHKERGQSSSSTIGGPAPQQQQQQPTNGQAQAGTQQQPANGGGEVTYITDPQRKRFFALTKKHEWTDDQVKELLNDHGISAGSKYIPKGQTYDKVCTILENRTYVEYADARNNPPAA